jgi:hypothetical protein
MKKLKDNNLLLSACLLLVVAVLFTMSVYSGHGGGRSWKKFYDHSKGVSFECPTKLSTEYIHPLDWPPSVAVADIPFTCVDGGVEVTDAGETVKRTIDGRDYCVTKLTEGAAGSMYTQYAYATEIENRFVSFTFGLRAVQCGNYDDPQRTACEAERATFNIDSVISDIVETVEF